MEKTSGEDYIIEKCIGEGGFGDVHLAVDKRSGNHVALKRVLKRNENQTQLRNQFFQEIHAGKLIGKHEGIVQMLGYFESPKHFWLVEEYFNGEELIVLIERKNFKPFKEGLAMKLFIQMISAVLHAHRQNVAHLDLKLDNILINSKKQIKVIDWGLSTSQDPSNCMKFCGSPEYCAPEIWFRTSDSPYNAFKADVFSLGVILYALIFGRFPFNKNSLQNMRKGFAVDIYFLETVIVNEHAKDLLKSMLNNNPTERISLEDVIQHPWFQCKISSSCNSS